MKAIVRAGPRPLRQPDRGARRPFKDGTPLRAAAAMAYFLLVTERYTRARIERETGVSADTLLKLCGLATGRVTRREARDAMDGPPRAPPLDAWGRDIIERVLAEPRKRTVRAAPDTWGRDIISAVLAEQAGVPS